MRKDEIMAITNESLVNKLGEEQLKWFRKVIYKWRRRELLFFNVEFHLLSELDNVDKNVAGRYIFKELTEKSEEKHKIYILDSQLDDYKKNYFSRESWGNFKKNQAINTIRHEILHAYVKERFRYLCKVDNYEADASIIFLMHLQFFRVSSGHDCAYAYKYSEIYKKVKSCKSYEEFFDLVIDTIIKINDVQKSLEDRYKDRGIKISFGDRNSKLYKFISSNSKYIVKNDNELRKIDIEAIIFRIGSATSIDKIEELIDKKIRNREIAEINEFKKVYMKKTENGIYNKEIILDKVS